MSLISASVLVWGAAALAAWLVGAVEIVTHIVRPPHRQLVRTLK